MTAPRSRKEEKKYDKWKKTADTSICIFCDVKKGESRFVESTKHFNVIKNEFPYTLWDNQTVTDHLMITPKKHTTSLSTFTDPEKIEYFDLVQKYESKGYNIFERAPETKTRSIPHQHTHLIKQADDFIKFIFSIHKPYLRITK